MQLQNKPKKKGLETIYSMFELFVLFCFKQLNTNIVMHFVTLMSKRSRIYKTYNYKSQSFVLVPFYLSPPTTLQAVRLFQFYSKTGQKKRLFTRHVNELLCSAVALMHKLLCLWRYSLKKIFHQGCSKHFTGHSLLGKINKVI